MLSVGVYCTDISWLENLSLSQWLWMSTCRNLVFRVAISAVTSRMICWLANYSFNSAFVVEAYAQLLTEPAGKDGFFRGLRQGE